MWSVTICCDAIDDVMHKIRRDMDGTFRMSDSQKASAYAILETSLTLFSEVPGEVTDDNGMAIISLDSSFDIDKRTTLLACMGMQNVKVGKLIGSPADVELTEVMKKCANRNLPKLLLTLLFVQRLHIRPRIFVTKM